MSTKRRIEYELGLSVDSAGIDALKRQLATLRIDIQGKGALEELSSELTAAYNTADELENILNRSWNSKLGQLDLSAVRREIQSTYKGVGNLKSSLEQGGKLGALAFDSFAKAVLNTNVYIKQSSSLLDEMATSMKNTIKWGITSSVFNNLTNSLQKAWSYSVDLDSSLNDIRIVTNKTADEMERFAKNANNAAKSLGASTKDYTKAALIYYQQGDSDEIAQAKADVTLKTANVTGQSGQAVSEQLTSVWNGYKVSAEEAELYIDKLAAVAAATASDLEELSTGMSKVASAANIMGVDIDQLNATLATVVSVTRQAPESVGTAFKTIYARMGDIEAGLDTETTLGSYTEKIKEIAGINVLDANGQLRDMGKVIEEIGAMWGDLTREQQISLSQVMAGTRQYNNLLSLFDNWDMYTEALNTSKKSAGELQRQQDIYMESTEAHLQKLSTEAEKTYDILFNTETVNGMTDAVTELMTLLNAYLSSFGGGLKSISGVALTLANIMNKQIGSGLGRITQNWQRIGMAKEEDKFKEEIKQSYTSQGKYVSDETLKYEFESTNKLFQIRKVMSEQEQRDYIDRQKEIVQLKDRIQAATEYEEIAKRLKAAGAIDSVIPEEIKDEKIFEEAEDNISNMIEELNKAKTLFSGNEIENSITKEDVIKHRDAWANSYKERYGEKSRPKNTRVWKSFQKEIELWDEAQTKQLSFQDLKREQILKTYLEELEVKDKSIGLTQQEAELQETIAGILNKGGKATEEEKAKILEYQNTKIKEQAVALDQARKGAKGLKDAQENTTPDMINNVQQMQNLQEATYQAKLEQQQLATTVQGLSAIGSVFTTFTGLVTALGDETATSDEKIKTIMMGLISMGGTLLMNWKSLSNIGPGLVILLNSATVALGGTATGVTTVSQAFSGLMTQLLPFMPIILGVVAAIALVTLGVKALIDKENELADASAAANNQAKILTTRFNELNNEAKELRETISSYSDILVELENLATVTDEFKNKLEEANQAALELIETYGLIEGRDYVAKDGALVINDQVLQNIQNIKDKQTRDAENRMYGGKIAANEAQSKYDAEQLGKKLGNGRITMGDYEYMGEYQTYDANRDFSVDEMLEIGNIFNKVKEEQDSEAEYLAMTNEQLKERILQEKDLSDVVRLNIDRFLENRSAVQEFADSLSLRESQNTLYSKQIAQNIVESQQYDKIKTLSTDDNGELNIARQNQITNFLSKQISDTAIKTAMEDINIGKKASSNNKLNKNFGYNVDNDEDLAKTYAKEVLGYTDADISKMTYGKGNNKGSLTDAEGKSIFTDLSDDEMREQLARTAEAKKLIESYTGEEGLQQILNTSSGKKISVDEQIKNVEELMKGAKDFGNEYGTDFTDSLLNSLTADKKEIDLSSLFSEIDPNEYEELMNFTPKQLQQAMGLDDETLSELGYGSAEEFAKNFKGGLDNYEWDVDAALQKAISKESEEIEGAGLESEEVQEYAKHLMSSAEAAEELNDEMVYNADAGVKVAKSVMRMNDGIEELSENFDNWKDILQKSSKSSEEYADAMNGIKGALSDVLGVEEDFIYDSFITNSENIDLITEAAKGSGDAIDELRRKLTDSIILKIAAENDLDVNTQSKVLGLVDQIQSQIPDIKVGTEIDMNDEQYANFFKMMQDIVTEAGLTAEQANALFSTMGFETEFVTKSQPVKKTGYGTRTVTEYMGEEEVTMPDGSKMSIPSGWETKTYPGKPYEYVDYVDTIAMSTDGNTPQIKTITKTGTGSMNNASALNAGGGKKSGSKPKKENKITDPKDRYHDINIELKQIANQLDKVKDNTDNLVGSDLIANLQQQYSLLNKEIDATARKIGIAKEEQDELQAKLAGQGVNFNKDGTIANYAEAWDNQLSYVNSIIDKYNAMDADAQEKYQDTLDKAKEDWDNFKENVERYDELITSDIPGLEADIREALDQQIEIKLEAFEYEIQIRLDMSEAERDWNEFKKKIIDGIKEDDILGNAKAKLKDFDSYYKENGTGEIQASTKHVNNILDQLKQMDADQAAGVYGETYTYTNANGEEVIVDYNNRKQALEDLKEYYTQIMDSMMELQELEEEIHQSYLDMMDEAQEKFDEQLETYQTIDEIIQHDMNLVKLMYGDSAGLADYYKEQRKNLDSQLDFQKQQVAFWRNQMDTLEEGSDAWEKAKENWMAAGAEWRSLAETNLQVITDEYLDAITTIFENLNNNVTNGMGLDYVSKEWDLINQNADRYLDQVNAIYETQSLQNKYLDAIENATNPAQQKKLNELMEDEIALLQEKDKLSQYDLDRANLKYEIAMKQMALEESQQKKTQLRLRRDSQGNYTYQYTNDDSEVSKLKNELSDLYNQLYNLDAGQYKSNLDELYNVWDAFQADMYEAAQINDPEKRKEREEMLEREYGELINGIVADNENIKQNLQQSTASQLFDLYDQNAENYEQMTEAQKGILDNFISAETEYNGMAFDNLFGLYNQNLEAFDTMTQEQIDALMSDFIPQWDSGVQQMVDTIVGEGGFAQVTKSAIEEIRALATVWDAERKAAYEEAKAMAEDMQTATQGLAKDNTELISTYQTQLEEVQKVIDKLGELKTAYEQAAEAAKTAAEEAYKYWQAASNEAANTDTNIDTNDYKKPEGDTKNVQKKESPAPTQPTLANGSKVTVKSGATTWASGEWLAGWVKGNNFTVGSISGNKVLLTDPSGPNNWDKGITGWIKKSDLVGFRSGGYTGNWNNTDGRLAMLHQKELVLNANDTKNILNAVEILRNITSNLGATLLSQMSAITANNTSAITNGMTNGDTLEQNVHIDAQFPNVNNANEIETALNNLVNMASQHIQKN